jgi:hypothetical protein
MKQNDLCKMMGTSKSVLQRTRKDLGMSSLYRHDVPIKSSKPIELTSDEILGLVENLNEEEDSEIKSQNLQNYKNIYLGKNRKN